MHTWTLTASKTQKYHKESTASAELLGMAQNDVAIVITLCVMGSGYHQTARRVLPAICPCCSQVILKGEIQQEPWLEEQNTF